MYLIMLDKYNVVTIVKSYSAIHKPMMILFSVTIRIAFIVQQHYICDIEL